MLETLPLSHPKHEFLFLANICDVRLNCWGYDLLTFVGLSSPVLFKAAKPALSEYNKLLFSNICKNYPATRC